MNCDKQDGFGGFSVKSDADSTTTNDSGNRKVNVRTCNIEIYGVGRSEANIRRHRRVV